MDLTIVLTIGKYAMLAAIYAFVFLVFRGIIDQLAAESRRERSEASAARGRKGSAPSRRDRPEPARAPVPPRPPAPERVASASPLPPVASPEAPPVRRPEPALAATIGPVREPQPPSPPQPPAEPVRRPAHLYVIESDGEDLTAGEEVPLSAAVTIGRSEENSLRLTDRFISSRHALICLRNGRRLLLDRGSTNGTFVNGERVEDEVDLRNGDRIAMGNTVFEYRTG